VNEVPGYRLEWIPFGGIKNSNLGYKEGIIGAVKGIANVKINSLPWDVV
jgi:aldehyde dehydrogenase (NAD+)